MKRLVLLGLSVVLAVGCGGEDGGDENAGGGTAGTGSTAATGSTTGTGSVSATGGTAGSGATGAVGGSGAAGAEYVPLPEGSRVHDHVLNLVDADATQALDEYLLVPSGVEVAPEDRRGLDFPSRLFLELYPDEYDFVVFLSTKRVSTEIDGRYQLVSTATIPGTGIDRYSTEEWFGGAGRLESAIGMDFTDLETRPPFAHEVAHRWAVHLDESIGFGDEFQGGQAAHWGTVSVNGQLGGFDAATLRCKIPAGAVPPGCTAEPDGRIHYVVGRFSPLTTPDDNRPFAPLELYMMGLADGAEIPQSYVRLVDAQREPVERDTAAGTVTIDASGMDEITLADIQAVHGVRTPLAESERTFTMAVVVLSATPATDEMMAAASAWAESFGGNTPGSPWASFEELTGGRARMNTRLGERRRVDAPPDEPPPGPEPECSVVDQDCGAGLACYDAEWSVCLPEGVAQLGDPCSDDTDCAAGLACAWGTGADLCAPYCDLFDATSPLACETLCPGATVEVWSAATMAPVGAYCTAGSGTGLCDPLVQDCGPGLGCYGRESAICQPAGSIPQGETCFPMGAVCEPGSACIGFQGADAYCQPYCDPDGTGADACNTLCPAGAWNYGDYSICMPN